MAPGVSLALSRSAEPASAGARRDFAGPHVIHRRSIDEHRGITLRRPGNGRTRNRRGCRPRGCHEFGHRAKSQPEQSALHRPADVAPSHSSRRPEDQQLAFAAFAFSFASGAQAGNPLRDVELRGFFENNSYGTDTSFQFMNWTVDNSGAYDYAADTRGFTL